MALGVLCLIRKKSKYVYYVMLVFMWILMAFTYGNADETIYVSRYTSSASWEGQTEIIYNLVIKLFNYMGASFVIFKAGCAFIQLFLISHVIKKYAKYPNFVLLLYFLFTFTIDIAQMRATLAMSVMLYFSTFLLEDIRMDCSRKLRLGLTRNECIYIAGILVATCIHSASVIWLLLLAAKKCSVKVNIIIVIACIGGLTLIFTPEVVSWIASLFGASTRISAYVSLEYQATRDLLLRAALIRVLIYAVGMTGIFLLLLNRDRGNVFLNFGLKMNIIILCIIPVMLDYTPEVYRLQAGLSVLCYICATNSLQTVSDERSKLLVTTKKNLLLNGALLVLAVINMYLLILRGNNYAAVFEPVFTNNYLFDLLK